MISLWGGTDEISRHWKCFKCLSGGSRHASKLKASNVPNSDSSTPLPIKATLGNVFTVPPKAMDLKLQSIMPSSPRTSTGNVPAVPPTVEHENVPSASEDRSNQQEATVGYSDRNHDAKSDTGISVLAFPKHGSPNVSLSHVALVQTSSATSEVRKSPLACDQVDVDTPERTEVPNTPTQRSSQLNILSPVLKIRDGAREEGLGSDDESILVEPNPQPRSAPRTTLCSICKKLRILAKFGDANAIWYVAVPVCICASSDPECSKKCRDASRIAKSGELEIPETPESTTRVRSSEHKETIDLAPENTTSKLQIGMGHASVPWFESGLVATAPKIKQKVGQKPPQEMVFATEVATEAAPLLCPDDAVPICQVTDEMPQMSVPKRGMTNGLTDGGQSTPTKKTQNTIIPRLSLEGQNKQTLQRIRSRNRSRQSSHSPSSSPRKRQEDITSIPIPDCNMGSTSDAESTSVASDMSARDSDQSPTISRKAERRPTQKRYTMRQLARMALVSANGSRMTSSQIVVWIARTFSHLNVGEGGWEKSVYACLSKFPEFDGRKIAEASETKKLYGFTNANYRTQYEKEYSEFFTALTSQPAREPQQDIIKQRSHGLLQPRAVKSAAFRSPSIPMRKELDAIVAPERHKPTVQSEAAEMGETSKPRSRRVRKQAAVGTATKGDKSEVTSNQAGDHMNFTPFGHPAPRESGKIPNPDFAVEQVTTFQDAYAGMVQPSIDTMTKAEKAQKIAEIKARPSRKKYFGSNYKLAHKLRHNLADIHDERDGAWKPPLSTANVPQANLGPRDGTEMNKDEGRTLREVFDLPGNMIPMNDGYTELAFRDGTLVSLQDALE
jgi:hypothetical protein